MRYDPALDGLRAIAVIVVMAFHAGVPGMTWGYLGVDVFFVLSGYLITRILREHPQPIGQFYLRRALRLYPALLLMLVVFGAMTGDWLQPALAALYVTDFTAAFSRTPADLIHTWSLSVEEHFYLLWPLVLPFLARAKDPRRVLLVAWAVMTAWRVVNFFLFGWDQAYFRFDTRGSGILLGAALAYGVKVPRWCVLLAIPAAVASINRFELQPLLFGMPLMEIATAAVILQSPRMLAPLAPLGVLSYGLYLWHLPIMRWMYGTEPLMMFVLGLALSLLMALLSYLTVERAGRLYRDRIAVRWFKPAAAR